MVSSFDAAAAACQSIDTLRILIDCAANELGFKYFALLHHASLHAEAGRLIRLDSYPTEWDAELRKTRLFESDPVHAACQRANAGFAWSDLGEIVQLTTANHAILERGRTFGIVDGFTVPGNVPGEPCGSCTFSRPSNRKLSKAALQATELIGSHAFAAARRIHGFPALNQRPHLSRRERECVELVAAGKTDWEIAAILGLSPETVHQYVKRARRVRWSRLFGQFSG